jgi:hypothetical protein
MQKEKKGEPITERHVTAFMVFGVCVLAFLVFGTFFQLLAK